MKNILASLLLVSGLIVSLTASADDPRVTDRKEKPTCHTYCETCRTCVERDDDCGMVGGCCVRWESYQCNCREVCN